jgi:hypothetical protein
MQFVCSYCGPIDWNNKYSYSYSYELTPENIKPSGKIPNIQVVRLLAHGRWFSPGNPASSTTKTGRHDIAEILLKVTLRHQKSNQINQLL